MIFSCVCGWMKQIILILIVGYAKTFQCGGISFKVPICIDWEVKMTWLKTILIDRPSDKIKSQFRFVQKNERDELTFPLWIGAV